MITSLLLLGEYDVGKTHFGGQLLGRLHLERGVLRMDGVPTNLAPFQAVLDALSSGRAAPHTPERDYLESRWPVVEGEDRRVELIWPDYGGEQISTMRDTRRMSAEWQKRVRSSDGWIIMVRIQRSHPSDDILSRPLADLKDGKKAPEGFKPSAQAKLVDFLQWLMHIRRTGTLEPIAAPALLLLLSCWDELGEEEQRQRPRDVLANRMPLVAAFVEANWRTQALQVLGVSALERRLKEDQVDEEYVERGPEQFGYVVLGNGQRDPDLTRAIAALV